jgi:hypothetical protein
VLDPPNDPSPEEDIPPSPPNPPLPPYNVCVDDEFDREVAGDPLVALVYPERLDIGGNTAALGRLDAADDAVEMPEPEKECLAGKRGSDDDVDDGLPP